MNNERIQVSHVEASSRVQTPEILITGGDSIKIYDVTNDKMGSIVFQDADFSFFTDFNGFIFKSIRSNPEAIEDGTIAHNSVVVHKNNVNETVSGIKTFVSNILAPNLVYNTENQTISGVKTFLDNLNISGDLTVAGTIKYNEVIDITTTGNISGYTGYFQQLYANNLVYNIGDQSISGNKTFLGDVSITGGSSKLFTVNTNLNLNVDELSFTGVNVTLIDGNVGVGTNNPTEKLEVSGNIRANNGTGIFTNMVLESFNYPPTNKTEIVSQRINDTGNFLKEIISMSMNYSTETDALFGQDLNTFGQGGDKIVFYQTGMNAGIGFSVGPYIRLGYHNIISEKNNSKLGIGTLFPQEKVHISGGNLRVEGDAIANNLVYNTGDQTISGIKDFTSTIRFSGQDILVAPASYVYITGNQTSIINGTKYLADTTTASFGFNLPASPTTGYYLEFADPFYTWSGNNFILSGNGNNVESDAVFTGDIEGASLRAIFVGKTYGWRIKYNL